MHVKTKDDDKAAVGYLIQNLSSKSVKIRRNVVRKLIKFKNPEIFEHILKKLFDSDKQVRYIVAKGLASWKDLRAVAPLIQVLKKPHEDIEVKCMATRSLGILKAEEALTPIKAFLLSNAENDNVRYWAIKALSSIVPVSIPVLIELLGNEIWHVRQYAAQALINIGKSIAEPILNVLDNQDFSPQEIHKKYWCLKIIQSLKIERAVPHIIKLLEFSFSAKELLCQSLQVLGTLSQDEHVADLLIRYLYHDEIDVRNSAKIGLMEMGDAAVLKLIDVLKAESWHVRKNAADVLAIIGDRKIEPLLLALNCEHPEILYWVSYALSEIGDISAVRNLVETYRRVSNKEVKLSILKALARIKSPFSKELLEEVLSENDEELVMASCIALKEIGEEGYKILVRHLSDNSWMVRSSIATVLMECEKEVIPLLTESLKTGNVDQKYWVIKILSRIGRSGVNTFIEMLEDNDPEVRAAIIETLGNLRATKAVYDVSLCLKDEYWFVRKKAAKALGNMGDASVIPQLKETLLDDDEELRAYSIESLGKLGGKEVLDDIVEFINDDYPCVRKAVINSLANIGGTIANSALVNFLKDEVDEVKIAAIRAIGRLKMKSALPHLTPLLLDDSLLPYVIAAMGEIGDEKAAKPLRNLLTNTTSVELKLLIMDNLGKIGDSMSERYISRELKNPNWRIRKKALNVLEAIKIRKERSGSIVQKSKDPKIQAMQHYRLGVAFMKRKQFDQAIYAFNKALDLNPKLENAYIKLGIIYEEKELYSEAKYYFRRACEVNPAASRPHVYLGLIYGMEKRYDDAIYHLETAIDKAPASSDAKIARKLLRGLKEE